jgi:hypothetical protein
MLAQTQKLVIETLGKNDKSSLELVELPGRKFLWGFGDLRDAEKAIKISSDAIEKIPKIFGSNKGVLETSKGCVLQPMSSQGKALAKIYILTKASKIDPLLPEFDSDVAVERLGETKFALRLNERLRQIRSDGKLTFELVSEDAAIIPNQQFELTPSSTEMALDEFILKPPPPAAGTVNQTSIVNKTNAVEKAKGEEKSIENDIKKIPSNLAINVQVERKQKYQEKLGIKLDERKKLEEELLALNKKFAEQQAQPKPKVEPKLGRYILLAKGVTGSETPVRLCYIKLVTLK